ncbi:ROK family transcriptional regulator [Tessaracoccus antarcticus]|uniref:ROK family transcriptional regulator n=1 Tax=Tessaracoccus antarcticus TaxID=2479848 RepID=A0A3M0GJH8_9ACTN|nr:ROK family transcriptional regulator [Tessaracoccus antarcticus]RMB61279.1 ROK family transcriptional regulator [Tessaracoccus antarcticus]
MLDVEKDRAGSGGSTPSSVRISNLALTLRAVLEAPHPVSRADVASKLGLTRSTVSRLVDELVAGHFLMEGVPVSGLRGRPGVPLSAAPNGLMSLGMEVNADRIATMVVDLSGAVVATQTERVDVVGAGPADALAILQDQALAVLGRLTEDARIMGARLALPALIDRTGTTVVRAPNLGWDGVQPAAHLTGLLENRDWGFRVSNDVDCSALTLLRDSPALVLDRGSFIYVTGEVGIGSSVVIDGQQLTGRHGWASELGHVCVVSEGGRACGCGAVGCLETVAGLKGILEAAGARSIEDLVAALNGGDERALRSLAEVSSALGRALGAALNLLDLQQVMLGGHLDTLAEWLLPGLRSELEVRVMWSPYEGIDVTTVGHDPTRTALGAAYAALAPVISNPGKWIDRGA